MVFLKDIFEKVVFEKNHQTKKKGIKIIQYISRQRVKVLILNAADNKFEASSFIIEANIINYFMWIHLLTYC